MDLNSILNNMNVNITQLNSYLNNNDENDLNNIK